MILATRRQLLQGAGLAALSLCLRGLTPRRLQASEGRAAAAAQAATLPSYKGYQELYREAWTWDRVVRGTHLRANCFSACGWDLYVKDGIVWREEQSDRYARPGSPLPEYGPRGCQKGACYSSLMNGPDRLRYPLERVGERGSGRWRRVSWEQALDRLADAIIDACGEGGPETVVYDNGTSNVDIGPGAAGEMRLFAMLGATLLDGFGGTGDLAMGAVQTWGTSFVDGSSDDWTRADTLVFWHCNPVQTRIPDAHFISEARYGGTAVVTVAPDYSPSSIHASLWVNPRPGTDAALALGLAREILDRGAIDEAYVREQSDLPFLVKPDGRFLRESDLKKGGSDEVFYFYDRSRGEVVKAPGTHGRWRGSIDLGGAQPALGGSYVVDTVAGAVRVRPVMALLRERLAGYTPQYVAETTGVGPGVQRRLAERLAKSERTIVYASWGSNKSYHADLLHRSLILLSVLRGQHGRRGAGVRFAAFSSFEGAEALIPGAQGGLLQRMLLSVFTPPPRMMEDGIAAVTEKSLTWTPSHLFLYTHGGLAEAQDGSVDDEALPRAGRAYMREAIEKGWARPRPAAERPPRVLVTSGVNPLRRWPLPQLVEKVLWPKLRTIAAIDFRLSSTGAKADLLLPAAGYYEKSGIKYALSLLPYVVVGEKAVEPLGESRSEWWIVSSLARRIQARARARGVTEPLVSIAKKFSEGGRFGADDDEAVIDFILRGSELTKDLGWNEARSLGTVPVRSSSAWSANSTVGSDYDEDGALSPSRIHVEDKQAWPTLTGRQQFYLDHPWFLQADEALPRYKPLPVAGGKRPILLTGGHNRWSIHAIWRAHPELLRLQRGEPVMWMAVADAHSRGLADGERARVINDYGSFEIQVRVAASVAPGEAIVYHAWEPYQFFAWRGNMEVVASPYKPVHLVGGYGHLRDRVFMNGPLHVPRGVPVDIERVA